MGKRQLFILGLIGALFMLWFIINLCNEVAIKTKLGCKSPILRYQIEEMEKSDNLEYGSFNKTSGDTTINS